MTDLYIIRHGEAHSNVEPYVLGGMKGCQGLTERGFAQARALATRLATGEFPAEILYASTLPRTRQTAEAVAEALKLPILWEDDLHELRPGEADGMTYEAARAVYPGFQTFLSDLYTPLSPGGESWASFQLRISQILATIVARHPGKRIAIVAHGGVIECSFMHLMGLGPQTRSRNAFHVRNTAITHWRGVTIQERHEWQLISHNDHIHLRAEHL